MPDTDWDHREREMAPMWNHLADRPPKDTTTYSWPVSIAIVAAVVLLLLALGWGIGWWLA